MATGTSVNDLVIVGAGPRGLSLALYSLYKGLKVTLVDPNPINSWGKNKLLPNLLMRSPASFDLVTYLEELQQYSLARYLNLEEYFSTDQGVIEECSYYCTRIEFVSYLQSVLKEVVKSLTFVEEPVVSIEEKKVVTPTQQIVGSIIALCLGVQGECIVPDYLKFSKYRERVITISELLTTDLTSKKLLVIGSGQGAAEIVEYGAVQGAEVSWSYTKEAKVSQYPAPSSSSWGPLSALGDYYSKLRSDQEKLNYLMKVKEWQPSITPYIASKLKRVDYSKGASLNNLGLYDYICLSTGLEANFNKLPFNCEIVGSPVLPKYPKLKRGYGSCSTPSIVFSGNLALSYDGPRQGSIISAGVTSKEIISEYF